MTRNMGSLDRILRAVLGLAIIGAGFAYQSWWGALGLIPLATSAVGTCPAYLPFGWRTCAPGPSAKRGA